MAGLVLRGILAWFAAAEAGSARWITSEDCVDLCERIEACATQASRPDLGRLLCHLAACEIGKLCGKKEVRSPSGKFHGPFQFVRGTWRSVCQPIFRKKGLVACSGKKAIYDTCCTTACAAEIIAADLNGGIRNWPRCGPDARRSAASE